MADVWSDPQADAFQQILQLGRSWGFSARFAELVLQRAQQGASAPQIMAELDDVQSGLGKLVDERFPERKLIRDKGRIPPAPAEIIEWRSTARQQLARVGAPYWMWNSDADLAPFIVEDWSMREFTEYLDEGYSMVANADQPVREAFAQLFGVKGDEALFAYIMDRDKALPHLQKQVRHAQIAGAGTRAGVNLLGSGWVGQLGRIEGTGISAEEAGARFAELNSQRSLFRETVSESQDLKLEREGVNAAFGLAEEGRPPSSSLLRSRLAQRQAWAQGGGRVAITERGR